MRSRLFGDCHLMWYRALLPSPTDLTVPGGNCEVGLLFNDDDFMVPEFLSGQEAMFLAGSSQSLFQQGADAVGMDQEQMLAKVGDV